MYSFLAVVTPKGAVIEAATLGAGSDIVARAKHTELTDREYRRTTASWPNKCSHHFALPTALVCGATIRSNP